MPRMCNRAILLLLISAFWWIAPSHAFPPMGQGLQPYVKDMLHAGLITHKSKLGFEETISAIRKTADNQGFCVVRELDITQDLRKAGYETTIDAKMLSLGNIDRASKLFQIDPGGSLRRFVPARVVVLRDASGDVFVGQFDLIKSVPSLGPQASQVLKQIVQDEKDFFDGIVE